MKIFFIAYKSFVSLFQDFDFDFESVQYRFPVLEIRMKKWLNTSGVLQAVIALTSYLLQNFPSNLESLHVKLRIFPLDQTSERRLCIIRSLYVGENKSQHGMMEAPKHLILLGARCKQFKSYKAIFQGCVASSSVRWIYESWWSKRSYVSLKSEEQVQEH